MNRMKIGRVVSVVLFLFSVMVLGVGCASIKLISDYDKKTDEAITVLQRKFETFFVEIEGRVGSDEALYVNSTEFYQQIKIDISAIQLRARALPENEITEKQISILRENVLILEEFHKEGIRSTEAIQPARDDFNRALSNILKLELAKMRGEGS